MSEPAWIERAETLRASGLSYRRVAREVSATPDAVRYWLSRRHGPLATCRGCGVKFHVYNTLQGKYCSHRCYLDHAPGRSPEATKRMATQFSRERKGDANPNYRHGERVGEHERAVIREFNLALKGEDRCRNCGSRQAVQAHHALPRSLCPAAKRELLNCLPLCAVCHSGWHRRAETIYRDCFTEREWEFLSAQEIGRNIEAWLDDRYPDRGRPWREARRVPDWEPGTTQGTNDGDG